MVKFAYKVNKQKKAENGTQQQNLGRKIFHGARLALKLLWRLWWHQTSTWASTGLATRLLWFDQHVRVANRLTFFEEGHFLNWLFVFNHGFHAKQKQKEMGKTKDFFYQEREVPFLIMFFMTVQSSRLFKTYQHGIFLVSLHNNDHKKKGKNQRVEARAITGQESPCSFHHGTCNFGRNHSWCFVG